MYFVSLLVTISEDACKLKFCLSNSKKKLRALCGKWVDALYSYDMDVWEKYQEAVKSKTYTQSQGLSQSEDRVWFKNVICYYF